MNLEQGRGGERQRAAWRVLGLRGACGVGVWVGGLTLARLDGAVVGSISMRLWWAVFLGVFGACGSKDEGGRAAGETCSPTGLSAACACPDGRTGAQRCEQDGSFAECQCTGGGGLGESAGASPMANGAAGAPGGHGGMTGIAGAAGAEDVPNDDCDLGDVAGCACAGESGQRFCVDGSFGACLCQEPAAGAGGEGGTGGASADVSCNDGSACDLADSDCRRARLACPNDRVAHALPFHGGVYFEGTLSEGNSERNAVAQVWPKARSSYFTGFGTYGRRCVFRPTDDALLYHDLVRGIVLNGSSPTTEDDVVQLTPPCGDRVGEDFGFDGSDQLHYRCDNALRRGNGELIARGVAILAGVIGDGRSVVVPEAPSAAYAVLAVDGTELGRLYPADSFAGHITLLPLASTTRASTAYVAFLRQYEAGAEVVVYVIDEESRFRLLRRAPVNGVGSAQLVVSDGTFFVREYDPTSSGDERVYAYLPDGSRRVVWREAETLYVRAHGQGGLLQGRAR